MRKYAAKGGDFGVAWDGSYAYVLVIRRDGQWFYYWLPVKGESRVGPKADAPVYRLTGWGADGPSEQWVEPMPPVEVKVGMAVAELRDDDDPDDMDWRDMSNMKSRVWDVFAIHSGHVFMRYRHGGEESFTDMWRFRHAATGAPLVLPRETPNA